jgi:hypothetical protein
LSSSSTQSFVKTSVGKPITLMGINFDKEHRNIEEWKAEPVAGRDLRGTA